MAQALNDQQEQEKDRDPNEELLKFLNELRVMMPGVQVLFAFLLTVPFTERFQRVTDVQRSIYTIALLCAAAATVTIVAPTINHRVRWHEGAAEDIMSQGNRLVIAGTIFLAISMGAAVYLVSDIIFDGRLAAILAAGLLGSAVWLWWGRALLHRSQQMKGRR